MSVHNIRNHTEEWMNLSVSYTSDGVLIEWHLATSQFCQNNINYSVTVEPADHWSNNSFSITSIVFGMTRTTVPLQLLPDQEYTVLVTALISSCDSITATRNFARSDLPIAPTMNRKSSITSYSFIKVIDNIFMYQ